MYYDIMNLPISIHDRRHRHNHNTSWICKSGTSSCSYVAFRKGSVIKKIVISLQTYTIKINAVVNCINDIALVIRSVILNLRITFAKSISCALFLHRSTHHIQINKNASTNNNRMNATWNPLSYYVSRKKFAQGWLLLFVVVLCCAFFFFSFSLT